MMNVVQLGQAQVHVHSMHRYSYCQHQKQIMSAFDLTEALPLYAVNMSLILAAHSHMGLHPLQTLFESSSRQHWPI